MIDIWNEALALLDRGEHAVYVLVTQVQGHAPQVPGARMVVRADGSSIGTVGGGAVEHEVIERALEVLATRRPVVVSFKLKSELGMCCGGSMEVYMEPLQPSPTVVIFGAGHVGQATALAALAAGFRVRVVDARAELMEQVSARADRSVAAPLDVVSSLGTSDDDLVVVTTHDHTLDKQLLTALLPRHAGYIGMIGSSRKVGSVRRHLELEGLDATDIDRVHMPIGLDIFAETPAEIAVSIVGELIRHRRSPTSAKTTRGSAVASKVTT